MQIKQKYYPLQVKKITELIDSIKGKGSRNHILTTDRITNYTVILEESFVLSEISTIHCL